MDGGSEDATDPGVVGAGVAVASEGRDMTDFEGETRVEDGPTDWLSGVPVGFPFGPRTSAAQLEGLTRGAGGGGDETDAGGEMIGVEGAGVAATGTEGEGVGGLSGTVDIVPKVKVSVGAERPPRVPAAKTALPLGSA